MSDILDPSKLKVTELRAELQARGLSTKGNKPVLIERLREALEAEGGCEVTFGLFPLFCRLWGRGRALSPLCRGRLSQPLLPRGLGMGFSF